MIIVSQSDRNYLFKNISSPYLEQILFLLNVIQMTIVSITLIKKVKTLLG